MQFTYVPEGAATPASDLQPPQPPHIIVTMKTKVDVLQTTIHPSEEDRKHQDLQILFFIATRNGHNAAGIWGASQKDVARLLGNRNGRAGTPTYLLHSIARMRWYLWNLGCLGGTARTPGNQAVSTSSLQASQGVQRDVMVEKTGKDEDNVDSGMEKGGYEDALMSKNTRSAKKNAGRKARKQAEKKQMMMQKESGLEHEEKPVTEERKKTEMTEEGVTDEKAGAPTNLTSDGNDRDENEAGSSEATQNATPIVQSTAVTKKGKKTRYIKLDLSGHEEGSFGTTSVKSWNQPGSASTTVVEKTQKSMGATERHTEAEKTKAPTPSKVAEASQSSRSFWQNFNGGPPNAPVFKSQNMVFKLRSQQQ